MECPPTLSTQTLHGKVWWGELTVCLEHPTKLGLAWNPACWGLAAIPGQMVSPAVPPCTAMSGLSFALGSLWGRGTAGELLASTKPGQAPVSPFPQHPQLSVPPDGHTPAFPSPCVLSPITPQPALAFPWQWVLLWELRTASRCQGARTHTWSRCMCTVSAKCPSLSVPLWSV